MLPHYRTDAINNETGREKTKRGTSPVEAGDYTTASTSKIRIAYLGCVNEWGVRPLVWGGSKKWHRSRGSINSSPKNHYAGVALRCARVRIVFKSASHSGVRRRGGRRPPTDCNEPPAPRMPCNRITHAPHFPSYKKQSYVARISFSHVVFIYNNSKTCPILIFFF